MAILQAACFFTLINLCLSVLDPCYVYSDEFTYDLTHPFYDWIPAYPGLHPEPCRIRKSFVYGESRYFLSHEYFVCGLAGTSMSAPAAFVPANRQISEIPFSQLVKLNGRVIDVSDQAKVNPNYELTVDDIVCYENEYGCFGPGTVIIIFTGWASRWPNKGRVFGEEEILDVPVDYNYPGLCEDAARYLASQPNVYGVMIDTPGVDSGAVPIFGFDTYTSSRILARENKYIVQNVNMECSLPYLNLKIYILPLYVLGGTSAPVRIFAHVCQDQCPVPSLPPSKQPPPPPPPYPRPPPPPPPPKVYH